MMHTIWKRRLTGRLLAALCVLLGFTAELHVASAQDVPFGIRPQDAAKGYFTYTLAPGAEVQDALLASNSGDAPLPLQLQIVRGVTAGNGGISFGDDATGPAAWVTLTAPGAIILPAKGAIELPFTLAVPPGTPAGEYVIGFVATPVDDPQALPVAADLAASTSGAANANFEVKLITEVAVAAVVTVPDATRCEAAIASLTPGSSSGRWQLDIGLRNTGNRHFRATGDAIARPAGGGAPIARKSFNVGYFIPGDSIDYPLALEPYPAAGDYQVEVRLVTDCGYTASYQQGVSISAANVQQAAAERVAEQPAATSDEAARLQAQAQLIQSIGMLVGGIALLLLVAVVAIFLLRRRQPA